VSGPVFKFCAPGRVLGVSLGVRYCFQVFRSRTRFRRYPGRQVLVSSFALPDAFSASLRASGPVLTFCAFGRVLGVTERVVSRLQVLRSGTRFRCYRGYRVLFSSFALPDAFWAIPGALCPVFKFCAPGRVFDVDKRVGTRLHVLRSPTLFRRFRAHQDPFSLFALPYKLSALPSASGTILTFCDPGRVLDVTEGVGPFYKFCAPGCVLGVTEGVKSCLQVLRSRTRFRQY